MSGNQRRRQRRLKRQWLEQEACRAALVAREQRLAELLPEARPATEPLVVGAGWFGRGVATAIAGSYLLWGSEPDTSTSVGDWISLAWGLLFGILLCCRVAMWRIAADAGGLWIRRFGRVRRLPWDRIRMIELHRDGTLNFAVDNDESSTILGAFVPPLLQGRLRIPPTGRETADRLALMARHPELRPTGEIPGREVGLPLAVWALVALGVLAADWFLLD
ncbi:PH domain-containing protein [Streptomyces vastus]|uniref:PH domain-containing protein n=1 Tax=Streptomyces vastus TaxID=285451 RepID=A0ABN3QB34_9ACTN